MAFFWRDLFDMVYGLWRTAKGKRDPGARLALQQIIANNPANAHTFVADRYIGDALTPLIYVGWISISAGLLLLFFDRMSKTNKRLEHATYAGHVLVGLC